MKTNPRKTSRRSVLKAVAAIPISASLEKPIRSRAQSQPHIAVIGAGAFGGWTALHLRRTGARVTLLDAWGPGNSRASSGGDTRVIRGIYGPDRIYVQLVVRAFELWKQYQKRWKSPLYHPTGTLWMFGVEDDYARASLPLLKEVGLKVDRLSSAQAQKKYPQVDFDGVTSLYYEREAGYLTARRACGLVARSVVEEGGDFKRATVRPGPIQGASMRDIRLSDGSRFQADRYVFACGPWMGTLFPKAIGERILSSRQEVHYFGTPQGNPLFDKGNLPIWIDFGERVYYGIPGADGRGFKVADDTRGAPFDPTHGERTPSAEGIARARQFLAKRFPTLEKAPLLEARVCQYENSPDGHFILDRHPGADNVWLVGGGSGHGFKLGPAWGEYVAKRVLDQAEIAPFFALSRLADPGRRSTQFQKPKSGSPSPG